MSAVLLRVFDGIRLMGLIPYTTLRYTVFSLPGHGCHPQKHAILGVISFQT